MAIFTKENGKKALKVAGYVVAGVAVCGGIYYAVKKFSSGGVTDVAEVATDVAAPIAEAIKKLS